jgi:hypothetical protein
VGKPNLKIRKNNCLFISVLLKGGQSTARWSDAALGKRMSPAMFVGYC